jgi:hypothetical protein
MYSLSPVQWHSTTSAYDEEWTEDLFEMVLRKKSLDNVTLKDFGDAFGRTLTSVHTQPSKRTFGGCVQPLKLSPSSID